MEFLHLFLTCRLARKPAVASPNIGCFLRLLHTGPRTRMPVLLPKHYSQELDYVCDAGYKNSWLAKMQSHLIMRRSTVIKYISHCLLLVSIIFQNTIQLYKNWHKLRNMNTYQLVLHFLIKQSLQLSTKVTCHASDHKHP